MGESLKRALVILLALAITAVSQAETRWCPILGLGPSDTMRYPPIARAAHVYGVVIGRIQFQTSGAVTGFEVVSGPPIFLRNVTEQVRAWRIVTSATGPEQCQGLAIFKFYLDAPGSSQSESEAAKESTASGILTFSVWTRPICLCDPAAIVSRRNWFRRLLSVFKDGR